MAYLAERLPKPLAERSTERPAASENAAFPSEAKISLSAPPRALPQAACTKGSLAERIMMSSTPLALISFTFWIKGGMWLAVHVGVKAPGTDTITTFFEANSFSVS